MIDRWNELLNGQEVPVVRASDYDILLGLIKQHNTDCAELCSQRNGEDKPCIYYVAGSALTARGSGSLRLEK